MQSFELLGGKYQQGERIAPGVIETFRSYELPTGRPVFIHRVPVDHAAAQEMAGLLSAGLIRSSVVRKMIVDVYETGPFRFVVTEPSRQCVPFRDWLEREVGEAETDEVPVAPPSAPEPTKKKAPEVGEAPKPEDVKEKSDEASDTEFARLFHEALSGKMEKVRKNPATIVSPEATAAKPAPIEVSAQPTPPAPVTPPVQQAEREFPSPYQIPQFYSPVTPPPTARSNLVVFLVVLGVVVVAIVMFAVLFLKK